MHLKKGKKCNCSFLGFLTEEGDTGVAEEAGSQPIAVRGNRIRTYSTHLQSQTDSGLAETLGHVDQVQEPESDKCKHILLLLLLLLFILQYFCYIFFSRYKCIFKGSL